MTGEAYISIAVILFMTVMTMIEIAFKLDQVHYPLKLLLIWVSILFTIPITQIGVRIMVAESMAADLLSLMTIIQVTTIIVSIVSTAYFMIYVLHNSLTFAANAANRNPLRTKV
jgi:hypothetical protein